MSSASAKVALRAQALARRALTHEAAVEETHDAQCAGMLDLLSDKGFLTAGAVIATYAAIGSEADPEPIRHALFDAQCIVALPAIADGDLVFRSVLPATPLIDGPMGTREPYRTCPAVRPFALIVPLLAFDLRGARLGHGKGYYDRALRSLRGSGPVFAVGLAFEAQRVDILPWEKWDEPLDAVVTEIRVREFSRSVR